jgi:hypothetical protein
MTDNEEVLKARVEELMSDLNYYLLHYRHLIANGYRKKVLDAEIESIRRELDRLTNRYQ